MKRNLHLLLAVLLSISAMPLFAETTTVEAVVNYESGIQNASYTATLTDGTILGFYRSGSYTYFCGAITTAASLVVPEIISYNGTEYNVQYFGYSSGGTIDFDEATSLKELTLPASITSIINYIPSTITDLHLLGENPPSMSNSGYKYIGSATVWVPQSSFSTYQSLTTNNNSSWYGVEIHYEGWNPQSLIVQLSAPGTFASELMKQVSQWSDVDALTVIGSLNIEEMELFSRFSQLQKLDLSQTDIKSITGCHGLTKLKQVILPTTVTEIGYNAFSGCIKLNDINTPNVVTVGSSAFNGCSALTSISLPLAEEVESGGFNSSGLIAIALPKVKEIGSNAFSSCRSLSSISIPDAESLGERAFYQSGITSISLPKVTSIGSECFENCEDLQSVSLAEGLEVIPNYCFEYCQNLNTIKYPSTLKSIGRGAFLSVPITSAILPEGMETIGYYAFQYCPLATISIPSTIQSIESDAFRDCSGVKDVYCYAIVPPNTEAFTETGMTGATLHVPTFSLTSYMLDNNWYRFNQTVAIEGKQSKLTINQNFTISTHDGLADKVNMDLTQTGHLTVSAGSTFNIGTFTQQQATTSYRYWDSNSQKDIYTGISTLIVNSEIKADNINLNLQVRTNCWNFISFPFDVNVAEIEYPEGTLWVIRKYSGADRAALTGNTWQNMTNGMVLQAGEGYILHCANEENDMVEFVFHPVNNAKKNGLFAYQDIVKPLNTYASEHAHNRSWNLVGNPYPAYFDTRCIEHNGVITVYNGDSYYGSYTAYSLLDDNYVLRPNEAFFVQCPIDATSMTFKAEGRIHEYSSNDYYSPTRVSRTQNSSRRKVYNFILSNEDMTDRTRLVLNPEAKMDYEISCDASKFMSDNQSAPQLYICDNGIRYAIDERPIGDGVVNLGIRVGQAGEYTIQKIGESDADAVITLFDNEAGKQVNLAKESYSFMASAGTIENRFVLYLENEATGIYNMNAAQSNDEGVIYDMSGRRVSSMQTGIYILKQNGKFRKVIK